MNAKILKLFEVSVSSLCLLTLLYFTYLDYPHMRNDLVEFSLEKSTLEILILRLCNQPI